MSATIYGKAHSHSDPSINKLVGRRVVAVRHMTDEEIKLFGWYEHPQETIVIQFDDDTLVIAMSDPESNGAGYLHVQEGKQ